MKKTVALFSLLVIFGCTKETPIEKSISEYVQTNIEERASYEKISIKVLDTVTVGDEVKEEKAGYKNTVLEFEHKNNKLRQGVQNEAVKAYIKDNSDEIDRYKKLIAERCKDSSSTETRYYTVSHKYTAKNSFGAKELHNDFISIDKDYKITGSVDK